MTTRQDLIQRIENLAPAIRERSIEADKLGRLHDETVHELERAEIFKALTPAAYGGLEFDWHTVAEIVDRLSAACASTGWVANAYICSMIVVAAFPPETQREIFGDIGYALAACPMNPLTGKARRVNGGWRVKLKAPFGSGVYHSNYAILCATVEPDEQLDTGAPQALVMVIPRADFTFDTASWAVLGMRGTCSATIIVEDAFVPDSRALDFMAMMRGDTPGRIANNASIYKEPYPGGFGFGICAAALGTAKSALFEFRNSLSTSVRAMTGLSKRELASTHIRIAEAASLVDAADALLYGDARKYAASLDNGAISEDHRLALNLHGAFIGRLCRAALSIIQESAGASVLRDGTRLQLIYRNLTTALGNYGFQFDAMAERFGRSYLGLSLGDEPY